MMSGRSTATGRSGVLNSLERARRLNMAKEYPSPSLHSLVMTCHIFRTRKWVDSHSGWFAIIYKNTKLDMPWLRSQNRSVF